MSHDPEDAVAPLPPLDEARLEEIERFRPVPRISVQAFCESEGVLQAVERAGHDRRMAKAYVRAHMGGIRAAAEHYAGAPTPNLVILETREAPTMLLEELELLAENFDPGSKVVVIGHHNDIALYRELMRRGISEYLVAPISIIDVLDIVTTLFVAPDSEPLGRTIAFVGAKGGVGSSTIAHNVAWSISRLFESDVVIADMDLAFGTANINFDQDPPQGMGEALAQPDRMDDVFLDRLLAKCADHLSLLAAPSLLDRTYDFGVDAFSAIIETAQRGSPVVVLDVPHVWNDWTRQVLSRADDIVITATPDLANLRNAKNLVDTLGRARPNDRLPKLVLNQLSVPKRPEIPIAEFVEPLGLEVAAQIQFDPAAFGQAGNAGQMLGESDPKHAAVESFSQIAHLVTGRGETRRKRKVGGQFSLLGRLKSRLRA